VSEGVVIGGCWWHQKQSPQFKPLAAETGAVN
jgi:hypothetical protein